MMLDARTADRSIYRPSVLHLLAAREAGAWWRTRTWWVHLLAYVALVNGLGGLVLLELAGEGQGAAPMEATLPFFMFHLLFVSAGVIVTAQGAIVGEIQRGTAAWILSKPASRTSFVLAKALGLGGDFLVVGAVVPLALALPAWRAAGLSPSVPALLLVLAGLGLIVAFFLALTLFLGTLFTSRAAVAGSAFAFLFLLAQFGDALPQVLPSGIPFELAKAVHGGGVDHMAPFAVTAAAIAALLAAACWRFRRIEL